MRDEDVLAESLADLERTAEPLSTYLSEHPELPSSVQAALLASDWARCAPRPVTSPRFRARARRNFAMACVAARDGKGSSFRRLLARLFSPSPLRAAAVPLMLALFVSVGTLGLYTASAAALPDTPLYSTKLAFDEIRVATALTPEQRARAHLTVAAERLSEAQAERRAGHLQAASQLLARYQIEEAQARESVGVAGAAAPTSAPPKSARPTQPMAPPIAQATEPPRVGAPTEDGAASGPVEDGASTEGQAPSSAPTPDQPREASQSPEPPATRHPESRPATAGEPARAAPGRVAEASAPPTPAMPSPPVTAPGVTAPSHPAPRSERSRPRPTDTPAPSHRSPPRATAVPPADSGALLRLLLLQASQGDPAAATTLDQYVQSIQAGRSAGNGWKQSLLVQRAALAAALHQVPAGERWTIEGAIAAIDTVLAPGGQQPAAGPVPTPPSPPSPPPVAPSRKPGATPQPQGRTGGQGGGQNSGQGGGQGGGQNNGQGGGQNIGQGGGQNGRGGNGPAATPQPQGRSGGQNNGQGGGNGGGQNGGQNSGHGGGSGGGQGGGQNGRGGNGPAATPHPHDPVGHRG